MSNEISATTKPGLIDRVGEKVEPRLRAVLRRIPPRVSLLTGSVFILVTLYLPLAVNSCGDYSGSGRDIVEGHAYWPSAMAFAFDAEAIGRWFYIFLLAWAGLALFLALVSLGLRKALGKSTFLRSLAVTAGVSSLVVLADYAFLFVSEALDPLVNRVTQHSDLAEGCFYAGVLLLAAVSCLRARAVRHDLPVALPFILACALLVCGAALATYAGLSRTGDNLGDLVNWLWLGAFFVAYFLGPLLVWLRLGSPRRSDNAAQWPSVRRRLALALVPAVAGQFYAAYFAIFEAHVWSLIPCLAGIHLITLGYMRLAQEVGAERTRTPLPFAHPAIADT